MIEALQKEIKFQKEYITTLKRLKKQDKIRALSADSRISAATDKLKDLKEELKKLEASVQMQRDMAILRKLAKKMKYDSVLELQKDLNDIRRQYSIKQIKKEFSPDVYNYFKQRKENTVYPSGPQPPTLGRYPAIDGSQRAKAVAGWKTFQQLPVDQIITLDIPEIPSSMKYLGPMNHLVYFTSKWSRRGGPRANMNDPKNLIPINMNVNYIHRWRKNRMHLLKHPEMDRYYITGKCKVLDVGIDDSNYENQPPDGELDYEIPSHVSEIGKLVEICYNTPEGKRKVLHFDSESTFVCADGEGLNQNLYLLSGKK